MRSIVLVVLFAAGCGAPAPGVEPARGRASGGDPVRISGDGFTEHGPPVVYFGPRAAKAVVVESRWLITVLAPQADAPGDVDVAIHFADGTIVDVGPFTYDDQGLVLRIE